MDTTLHVMIPEGHGIATQNRFRPACQPYARPIFIPTSERGVLVGSALPEGSTACPECAELAAVMAGLADLR